jgi:hypothetical protein
MKKEKIIVIGGNIIAPSALAIILWFLAPEEKILLPTILIVAFLFIFFMLLANTVYAYIKLATIPQNEKRYFSSKKVVENFYKFISIRDFKKAWDLLDNKQYLKIQYTYKDFSNGYKHLKNIYNLQIDIVSCADPLRHTYYVSYIDEFLSPVIENFRITEIRLIDFFNELKSIYSEKTDFFKLISNLPLRYFFLPNRDEFLTFKYPELQQYITSHRTKKIVRGFEITLVRKNKKTKIWKILQLSEISPLLTTTIR